MTNTSKLTMQGKPSDLFGYDTQGRTNKEAFDLLKGTTTTIRRAVTKEASGAAAQADGLYLIKSEGLYLVESKPSERKAESKQGTTAWSRYYTRLTKADGTPMTDADTNGLVYWGMLRAQGLDIPRSHADGLRGTPEGRESEVLDRAAKEADGSRVTKAKIKAAKEALGMTKAPKAPKAPAPVPPTKVDFKEAVNLLHNADTPTDKLTKAERGSIERLIAKLTKVLEN